MTDIKTDNNNEILKNAVKSLQLRFPNAEIERATGFKKSAISGYLNNKIPVSDAFLQTFSEAFKIDLKQFGYTKGLERIETKNPQQNDDSLKDKLIEVLENQLRRLENALDRANEEIDRIKNK
jgi:transcriptional regulator with XRE-family HTH domain